MRLEKREKDLLTLLLEDTEDLWVVSRLIEPGCIVRGTGTRKVAAGEKDVVKKTYRFELDAERIELHPAGLRVLGTVRNEIDDVPKGSYQSLLFEAGDRIEITRSWDPISENRLTRGLERTKHAYLIVIFDRESAVISEVSGKGSREIERMSGDVARKDYAAGSEDFFATIIAETQRLAQRDYTAIILAASSMWIDEIKKRQIPFSARFVPISGAESSSIHTLLERREIAEELSQLGGMNEIGLVEELLRRISTGATYAYGSEAVARAIEYGAAETVLVTQRFLDDAYEQGKFESVTQLLEKAQAIQARIEIIDTDPHAMMKLDSLGGLGALLRFPIE